MHSLFGIPTSLIPGAADRIRKGGKTDTTGYVKISGLLRVKMLLQYATQRPQRRRNAL